MLRRAALIAVLAGVGLLALTNQALAGWYVVNLDRTPEAVQANAPFTIGFTILMHQEAVPGLEPTIQAIRRDARPTSGDAPSPPERLTFQARAEGAPGHYVATLAFPTAGDWEWRVHPFNQQPEHQQMSPIRVEAAALQPASAVAATPTWAIGEQGARTALRWAGLLLLLAAAAVGLTAQRAAARPVQRSE
jgi:hypothetical protein